jgi:hypothetical protein
LIPSLCPEFSGFEDDFCCDGEIVDCCFELVELLNASEFARSDQFTAEFVVGDFWEGDAIALCFKLTQPLFAGLAVGVGFGCRGGLCRAGSVDSWEEGSVAESVLVKGLVEEFPGFLLVLGVAFVFPGLEEIREGLRLGGCLELLLGVIPGFCVAVG